MNAIARLFPRRTGTCDGCGGRHLDVVRFGEAWTCVGCLAHAVFIEEDEAAERRELLLEETPHIAPGRAA